MVFNFFKKVKDALVKTGSILGNRLRNLFKKPINDETLEELERLFYEADMGVQTAVDLTAKIQTFAKSHPNSNSDILLNHVREEIITILNDTPTAEVPEAEVTVVLVVGVNGNGKTTSVAKLAKRYHDAGKRVLVAAADTYRAAAIDQLTVWADRIGVEIVKGAPKSDASAVAFDALSAAKARQCDVVIIDTAGRLHTKTDLMQELEKIRRTCKKIIPDSPHETLLILDATTGQNGVDQAKIFNQYTPISGLVLTKLDGTAKGGIVISIHRELNLPVKYIGVGEGMDDLMPFDSKSFVKALLE